MTTPDWQLPPGVDRGLWDYLHSGDMVRGYDAQLADAPLTRADVAFCESMFPTPGRLLDLGCGTGRLCAHFAAKGFVCVGVDLSDEMLTKARENAPTATFVNANLVDLAGLPDRSFDYAACLFSTLGMVRGADNRAAALRSAQRVLKPGGKFVLHVHNRWHRGLGWRRLLGQGVRTALGRADAGDVTMPQAYGGAPLTLHHFACREVERLLTAAGFGVTRVEPVPPRGYGYLFAAKTARS
jgi:SAM-dependent methyltransferase